MYVYIETVYGINGRVPISYREHDFAANYTVKTASDFLLNLLLELYLG
jgi:hypothetical protein